MASEVGQLTVDPPYEGDQREQAGVPQVPLGRADVSFPDPTEVPGMITGET
jgi:hypothetical protein